MRVIIAGSRTGFRYSDIERFLAQVPFEITTVICGGAQGVDSLGRAWAHQHNIPVEMYLAEWEKYGKRAGYLRNVKMAETADALIAIWDGKSKGTSHMIRVASAAKLWLKVFKVDLTERLRQEREAAEELVA